MFGSGNALILLINWLQNRIFGNRSDKIFPNSTFAEKIKEILD